MGLGVLEDRHLGGKVPGTAAISSLESNGISLMVGKKRGKGRYSDMVLVPQPSDDPNDPLNWPQWRKDLSLVILMGITVIIGCVWIMLAPGQGVLVEEFGVSMTEVSKSTGAHILVVGFATFITSPLATKFGKRPVFLVCALILLLTNIWAAAATTWPSLFAARAVMGVGVAPFETLVTAWTADVYYVHERATRNALWNVSLSVGSSLGAVVGGYIIQYLGWRWCFWFCAITMGVFTPALFLFVPESVYVRDGRFETDINAETPDSASEHSGADEKGGVRVGEEGRKKSFVELLKPGEGVMSDASLWKLFMRTLKMAVYPAVIWVYLTYSAGVVWLALFGTAQAQIFSQPPYNFTPSQIGLTNLGGVVTALLGNLTAGPLVDYLSLLLSRHNSGIYEPEFRLPLVLPATFFTVAGLWGFGQAIHYQTHWIVPVVLNGLNFLGLIWTAIPAYGYVIDAHRQLAPNAFVMGNLVKAVASYVLTFRVNDWYEAQGPRNMFWTVGSVQLFGQLTTIVMYIYGKRLRSWVARNKHLKDI